jgi:hypothetical protein
MVALYFVRPPPSPISPRESCLAQVGEQGSSFFGRRAKPTERQREYVTIALRNLVQG